MKSLSAPQSPFREDINGLRAWAVVAVIFYHFKVPGFNGGFVGVDVFFVISGFLMTGIVVGGLERGESGFSVLAFYMARARRILPALIFMCATLLMFGWWTLSPLDYKMLAKHALSSLVFVSNIKFWREAGYFDVASHEKWLLHTWSLSVEWQFYLLLPLALLAVWKLRSCRRSITVVMAAGLLISLCLAVVFTPLKPVAAFYLLPTRAWEMLAGGLLYLLAHRLVLTPRQQKVMEVAGFALIMGAVFMFDDSSPWPGWRSLVPVVGSVMVLLAARSGALLTGHSVAQWFGTRSYSLYLWHWPVVVALVYLDFHADLRAVTVGLVLTMALGHLSYQWVENPGRKKLSRLRPGWGAAVLLCGAGAVAAAGAAIQRQDGIAGRFPLAVNLVLKEATNKNPRRDSCFTIGGTRSPSCIYGGDRLRAILIGDSHADAVVTALASAMSNPNDGIMDWSYAGCLTVLGVKYNPKRSGPDEKCGDFLDWATKQLETIPKNVPIIIVNRTSMYALGQNEIGVSDANIPSVYFSQLYAKATPAFLMEFAQQLTDTACHLAKDRTVYMVRPIPEMGVDVPRVMARAMSLGVHKDVFISLAEYHQRHAFVWAAQDAASNRCGVKILDPLPYLCGNGRCEGTKYGRPLYSDNNHLSEYGNRLLVPMFAAVVGGTPMRVSP